MKYERLTTNNVQSNKDFLLNFAFVKDGEVYLRGMGDDTEEIRLCDYIAIRAASEKGCNRTPQDILDGACNECNCELAALNIAAIQAAELRNRLAELEDKIESGLLLKLPCKVGDRVYYIDEYIAEFDKVEEYTVEKIEIVKDGIRLWFGDDVGYALAENFGKEVFTDKKQAEEKLKELQKD